MADVSVVALVTAFSAGIVSFLSPCVLPLVPGYVSYVAGDRISRGPDMTDSAWRWSALWLSICFVLGFSTVFIALGAGATSLGQLLLRYKNEANIAGGAIVMTFGLFMTGLLKFGWMQRDLRFHGNIRGARPAGAYLIGLAFAFGWTPCIGPVLGVILTLSAVTATLASGIALLGAYSFGLGAPFIATAMFTDSFLAWRKSIARIGRPVQIGAGVVMVVMGLAMITGQFTLFALWLLDVFPGLATIG